jgi:hypothetical protein
MHSQAKPMAIAVQNIKHRGVVDIGSNLGNKRCRQLLRSPMLSVDSITTFPVNDDQGPASANLDSIALCNKTPTGEIIFGDHQNQSLILGISKLAGIRPCLFFWFFRNYCG